MMTSSLKRGVRRNQLNLIFKIANRKKTQIEKIKLN